MSDFGKAVTWGAGVYVGVMLAVISIPLACIVSVVLLGRVANVVAPAPPPSIATKQSPSHKAGPPKIVVIREPVHEPTPDEIERQPHDSELSDPTGPLPASIFAPLPVADPLEEARRIQAEIERAATTATSEPMPTEPPPVKVAGVPAPIRTWTETLPDGTTKSVEARFVSATDSVVNLRTKTNSRLAIPLKRLADEDRRWIADYQK